MKAELNVPFDIPDVAIISSQVTSDRKLLIQVESQLKTIKCRCCGQEIECNGGYGPELKLRHLPVLGMETYVVIRLHRAKCPHCWPEEKTIQSLTWHEEHSLHTKAYVAYLREQLANSTDNIGQKENHRRNEHRHLAGTDPHALTSTDGLPHHRYVEKVRRRRRSMYRNPR